jgi:hypothetical protein
MTGGVRARITLVSAANSAYFELLQGLLLSLEQGESGSGLALSIFDHGLAESERQWLAARGAMLKDPGWDIDFRGRERLPRHFQWMTARPYIPQHFPGHEIYLWIDADAWVQDPAVIDILIAAARTGRLAIVPEIDRGYWTIHKPPKLWGQNQKAFAWSYGARAGYRLGRNSILNCGVFALRGDAPHWRLWADAYTRALQRRRLFRRPDLDDQGFRLSDQTALNYAVYADRAPVSFLPAYCNWFCGKGTPMYDAARRLLVEPHPPHQPLGIIHLAGAGMKERRWRLDTLEGGTIETLLTFAEVARLRER